MRSRTARIFSAWASAAGSGRFSRRSSSSCATRSMCAVRSAWEEVRDATLRSHARTAGATRRWRPETRVVRERGGRREGPREGVGGVREEEAHESGERERSATTGRRRGASRRSAREEGGVREAGCGEVRGSHPARASPRSTTSRSGTRDQPRSLASRCAGPRLPSGRLPTRCCSGCSANTAPNIRVSPPTRAGVLTRLPRDSKNSRLNQKLREISPSHRRSRRVDALRIARRIFASLSRWRPGPPCVAASRSSRRRTVARAPRTARRRGPAPKRSISTGALGDRGASPRRARAVAPARDPRSARLAPARSPFPPSPPPNQPPVASCRAPPRVRVEARDRDRAPNLAVFFSSARTSPERFATAKRRVAIARPRARARSPSRLPASFPIPHATPLPFPLLPARSKSLPAGSFSRPRASPRARRVRPPPRAASPRIPPAISPRIRSSRSRPSPPR